MTSTLQALKNKEERSLLLKKKLEENRKRLEEKMKTYELYLNTLQILKTNKESYLLLEPYSEEKEQESNWFGTYFPAGSWRLKWEEFPNSICYECEDTIEEVHIIKEFCKDFPANDQITIFWNNRCDPTLIMDLEIALKYADSLIEDSGLSDLWFLNKTRKRCIEVYHGGELCTGYSPIQD